MTKGIVDQIKDELEGALSALFELDTQREKLEVEISRVKDIVRRSNLAIDALCGTGGSGVHDHTAVPEARPEQPRVPAPVQPSLPPPPKAPSGPVCNSCGGTMVATVRTLQSGREVHLLACSDCSNERL